MMDLNTFKLLKEDHDHYELSHPSGTRLRIEKAKMTPNAQSLIQKLAHGGSVNPKIDKVPEADRYPDNILKAAEGAEVPDEPTTAEKLETDHPERGYSQVPVTINHNYYSGAPGAMPMPQQAPQPQAQDWQGSYGVSQPAPAPAPQQDASAAQPPSQDQVSSAAPGSAQDFMNQEHSQEQNLKEQGAIQGNEAGAQAQAYGDLASAQKNITQKIEEAGQQYHQKYDALAQDIASNPIKANNWWASKSTPSKIATAIGMLFSGAALGASGHPELAAQAIKTAIDRDIDSQKFNIENKNSLLNKYTEQYKSNLLGLDALKVQYGAITEGLIKQAAAKANNALASHVAQNAIFSLRKDIAPALLNITRATAEQKLYSEMSNPQSSGGDPESQLKNQISTLQALSPERAKDLQSKYVPGFGVASVPLLKEDVDAIGSYSNLKSALSDAINFSKKTGATIPGSTNNAVASSKKNSIVLELNKLHGLNRLNDNEFETYKDQVADPGSWRPGKAQAKLQEILNRVNSDQANLIKNKGIKLFNPGLEKLSPEEQDHFKMAKQRLAQNPNDMNAKNALTILSNKIRGQ